MTADDLDKLLNDPKTWVVTEFNNPNTKLHAAAPELLEALRELLYVTEPTFDNRHEREAALNAIAKATGEQHEP